MLGYVSDEEIIEVAVRALLSNEQDMRALVRSLVAHWPEAKALQVINALAMAAGTVEHMLASPDTKQCAQDCWRMAGLVGVDLWMMHCMDLPTDTAADLMAYWLAHDRFFLG